MYLRARVFVAPVFGFRILSVGPVDFRLKFTAVGVVQIDGKSLSTTGAYIEKPAASALEVRVECTVEWDLSVPCFFEAIPGSRGTSEWNSELYEGRPRTSS